MAESSRRKIPTRRRTAPRPTQPSIISASIEGWISDEDQRDEFVQIWKNKALISPKYITTRKFTAAGFEFPALFNFQGIRPFVEMQGNYCPDLVRVFYYNLKIRDEVALSKVKGVDIIIDKMIFGKMWLNFPSMMLQNQFSMGLMASIKSWPINLSYATQHRMLGDNYWLED